MNRPAWLVLCLITMVSALITPSVASADDGGASEVAFSVSGGELTYALSNGGLAPIAFTYDGTGNTTATGIVTLTIEDARGTFQGWSIAIESTPFTYAGTAQGSNDIPAANATINPQAPTRIAGPDRGGVHAAPGGSLATRRNVIVADPGAGSGAYSLEMLVSLSVPAGSPAGTYTALLTVAASDAPSSNG